MIELGSGFGYSGYWHSRAVGSGGELHLTDGDPENERKARDYLGRAGLWEPVTYHVGDAVTSMNALDGEFDVVYDDIDKEGYPDAWRAARERVRIGGLYVCDNVLWSGRVLDDEPDERTQAILEHNALIAEDERYVSTIVPTRDGVDGRDPHRLTWPYEDPTGSPLFEVSAESIALGSPLSPWDKPSWTPRLPAGTE